MAQPIRILLACGVGMSSGFMAAGMRKEAKKRGLDVTVNAVSKSEVISKKGQFDVLMLGPHFAAQVPEYKEQLPEAKVDSIDPDAYAMLDSEAILDAALALYNS